VEPKEQVLDAIKSAGEPLNAGAIAEMTGLDRKVVDKTMAELKSSGQIESPRRCYWQPAS
jgi:DNA-binding IscR family transcriptional regulator